MPEPRATGDASRGGYVTDVPYPRAYVPQITPPVLRLVAALNGTPPPKEQDFDYCELGAAVGDTLATLAAANPHSRFVGIELSPEHVAQANLRIAGGRLTNVRMLQHDFEDLAKPEGPELPLFDFIVAHGVWTWVSPLKRAALLAFVESHLKPGGLFYLSYNVLPGWSSVEPLRRLMLEHTTQAKSTLDRAREGVALVQRLADSGAAYLASHPTARSMLALMQKGGLPYVVHEYFHADWEPMYFADVARKLGESGFAFLGRVPLYANIRALAIPPSLTKMAESVEDRIALEGLSDFATNELFRSDVYVKGPARRAVSETQYYFEGTTFGTLSPRESMKREVKLPFYTLDFKDPVYDTMFGLLANEPQTAMALARAPALANVGQARVGDLLQNLVLGGQVVPMPGYTLEVRRELAEGARVRIPLPYNELVLEEALREEGPLVFASPVTGAGVQISLLEALCIRIVTCEPPATDLGAAVRAYAASRPMPITYGEKKIKDAEELVKIMAREIERFRAGPLKKLVLLGVLGPA